MNFRRIGALRRRVRFGFLLLALVIAAPAFASEKTEVVAVVHRFFDNLEDAKVNTAFEVCDSEISILDEFPPHVWHGATACADWWKGLKSYEEKEGIADGVAKLGAPWTVDVSGDRAYFVSPATYIYNQHGKPVKELHAVFTAALRKTDAGWRITSWTWSKH